jgi:hypothetical protein
MSILHDILGNFLVEHFEKQFPATLECIKILLAQGMTPNNIVIFFEGMGADEAMCNNCHVIAEHLMKQ